MKKQFLALSMIATSGLIAQGDAQMDNKTEMQNGYCNECCCTPCCCCVPKPKKCIDCVCYTAPFYDLQCDWGFNLDLEFLYWYGRETNLSYASKINMVDVNQDLSTLELGFGAKSYKNLGTEWRPGFRVGIGWNSCCDGWDYNLTWTWYRNKRKDSASVADYGLVTPGGNYPFMGSANQSLLMNPWINQSFHATADGFSALPQGSDAFISFDHVGAKWRLAFNQIDLDVGRKYWLSKCFNLRPYGGLRGAWTRAKFRTTSTRNTTSGATGNAFSLTFKDRFTTHAWGVGLLGGLQPTWYYTPCFALYANAGGALIWGDFQVKKRENYVAVEATTPTATTFPNYVNRSTSRQAQMTGMLDFGIGFRWEDTWCCDRYRTALDFGWEHHILFDQNHRNKSFDYFSPQNIGTSTATPVLSGYRTYAEATGNLGFGGFVLRFNWDF